MKMSVYDKNGNYSQQALELSKNINSLLEPVITEYMSYGMSVEEVLYVICTEAETCALMYNIKKRIQSRKEKCK